MADPGFACLGGLKFGRRPKILFSKDVSESSKFNIDVDEVEYYNLKVRRQETRIKSKNNINTYKFIFKSRYCLDLSM